MKSIHTIYKSQKKDDSCSQYIVDGELQKQNYGNNQMARKKINQDGMRYGGWTHNQNLKYLRFLERYKKYIIEGELRRKKRIFHKMSTVIRTRTSDQCRGHHQKLIQRFQNVEDIINGIRKNLQQNFVIGEYSKSTKATKKNSVKKNLINQEQQINQQSLQDRNQNLALLKPQIMLFQNQMSITIPRIFMKCWNLMY